MPYRKPKTKAQKEARKQYYREYYLRNKEKKNAASRRWHDAHPEYRKAHGRLYYQRHKDALNLRKKLKCTVAVARLVLASRAPVEVTLRELGLRRGVDYGLI